MLTQEQKDLLSDASSSDIPHSVGAESRTPPLFKADCFQVRQSRVGMQAARLPTYATLDCSLNILSTSSCIYKQ